MKKMNFALIAVAALGFSACSDGQSPPTTAGDMNSVQNSQPSTVAPSPTPMANAPGAGAVGATSPSDGAMGGTKKSSGGHDSSHGSATGTNTGTATGTGGGTGTMGTGGGTTGSGGGAGTTGTGGGSHGSH